MDGCVAQYVVVNSRFLMHGLNIPEFIVLQDVKKSDHYSAVAPKALFTGCESYFCGRWSTRRGHNVSQAQPVVNMEFLCGAHLNFFLDDIKWGFYSPCPARRKVGR